MNEVSPRSSCATTAQKSERAKATQQSDGWFRDGDGTHYDTVDWIEAVAGCVSDSRGLNRDDVACGDVGDVEEIPIRRRGIGARLGYGLSDVIEAYTLWEIGGASRGMAEQAAFVCGSI